MKKEITVNTEYIKLDSLLKFAGLAISGGNAKEVILKGLVKVNDEACIMRGKKIYPGDEVEYNGDVIKVVN